MDELKAEEAIFLDILLSLHYHPQVLTPCACGRRRKVACSECLQSELLCRQCWLQKHRNMPTHWALIWNETDKFFEKHDISRVSKNSVVAVGHYGTWCPDADPGHSFTLVDRNGIHATAISFCRCTTPEGTHGAPEFQQLLRAGIFPGSIKEPKTGYTLGLLEYYRQQRNQGKGSAYNFVRVLQRMADPFFAGAVPVSAQWTGFTGGYSIATRTYTLTFSRLRDTMTTSTSACDTGMHMGWMSPSLVKMSAPIPTAQ